MSSSLSMYEVFYFYFFYNNFGLFEDENIDEDDDDICCYLGKSRIDRKALLLMGREVTPDLPSGTSTYTLGEALNVRKCYSDEELFDSELSYSLVVWLCCLCIE